MNSINLAKSVSLGLILCALFWSAGQQVFAASEIRVHRANQYYQLKNRLNENTPSTSRYQHRRNQLYKKNRRSRAVPVPDSRFPNSYRAYDYYQRSQSQTRGQR